MAAAAATAAARCVGRVGEGVGVAGAECGARDSTEILRDCVVLRLLPGSLKLLISRQKCRVMVMEALKRYFKEWN